MIGRAALRNPWLIRDVWNDLQARQPAPAPKRADWVQFTQQQFQGMRELYGDRVVIPLFRQWIARYADGLGLDRARVGCLCRIADMRTLADELGWTSLGPGL